MHGAEESSGFFKKWEMTRNLCLSSLFWLNLLGSVSIFFFFLVNAVASWRVLYSSPSPPQVELPRTIIIKGHWTDVRQNKREVSVWNDSFKKLFICNHRRCHWTIKISCSSQLYRWGCRQDFFFSPNLWPVKKISHRQCNLTKLWPLYFSNGRLASNRWTSDQWRNQNIQHSESSLFLSTRRHKYDDLSRDNDR